MAILFLDSSGLVKPYIAETGSTWVQSVTNSASGNECYIAQITGAEMVSAVTRCLRRGDLTPADAATALAGFEADFRQNLVLLENPLPRVRDAMTLIRRHGLRGYDALQLAVALHLRDRGRPFGRPDPLFITADRELTVAALAEGLAADDPNNH